MDLDQAMFLERDGDGYVVHYAIADVAAFVEPGGAVDVEAHRRGETLYGADSKIPLHPTALSEGAASLLPDQVRPALVWRIGLDAKGSITAATVERARVRSRAKLSYDGVQADLDAGTADEMFTLLEEIGDPAHPAGGRPGRGLAADARAGDRDRGDTWRLEFRDLKPVEGWNAQISLLTGIAAASIMLEARSASCARCPPPTRRRSSGCGAPPRRCIDWPDDQDYPAFIRSLDPSAPSHQAMVVACTSLLRGAGYAVFDGEPPNRPSTPRWRRRTPT